MKLLPVTVVTAMVFAFAFYQTLPVLAEGADIGAASRPFPLTGGSLLGSDDRVQSSSEHSEGAERSGDTSSDKSQTHLGKAGETAHRGHRIAIHKRSRRVFALSHPRHRAFAFSHPRHRLFIHRRGHRFVALNEPSGA